MSDDFGTVNVRRGERGREIEQLRQHYLRHRDTLMKLVADAPTEHLAAEYQRLVGDIDTSLTKLAEIEGQPLDASATRPRKSEPGTRTLLTPPAATYDPDATQHDFELPVESEARSRVAMIVVAGLVVLALIGWLIWRASSDRRPEDTVAEQPLTETGDPRIEETETAPATGTIAPVVTDTLTVTPEATDYGTVRKGTRAVRQFEVTNHTDEPMSIELVRSACRCLFYDHGEVVPPRGKETVTVTVDGARAKVGALRETVTVRSRKDSTVSTTFEVSANIE